MKLTDLFINRPVLAIVVNLVILIAGLQSIRSLSVRQYPRSDIAVVRVTTAYVGANADLVRGFITTPLERVIASADGIDYMESSSAQARQHDHRPPEAQLRHQRRPHPDPGQGGAGAQRPAARGGGADHRAGDGGQPVRGHVPRLLVRRPGPEPDHRLPDARGAAQALRHQRRAAGRHPGRPHLRHAHLAEAREDGGPAASRPPSVRDALAANNYLSALGPHQGLDGVGQPGRQHRPAARPRSSASWWSRRRTASVVRLGEIADVVLGAENYDEDVRFNGQTATFMGIWVLPTANSLEVIARGARGHARDPGPAPGRHEGRASPTTRPLYIQDAIDEVLKTLAETLLIVVRGHLPVPGLVALGAHPGGGHPDLAGRRGVPHAGGRLHHQPADAARHRALGRAGGGRRDRHGGERRAPPARWARPPFQAAIDGGARAGRARSSP